MRVGAGKGGLYFYDTMVRGWWEETRQGAWVVAEKRTVKEAGECKKNLSEFG